MIADKTIYAMQHNKTKRIYIGFEKRIREHMCHLRNHNHINKELQKDFDLYGEDYSFYVLEKNVSHHDSFDVEKVWIRMLRSNEIERGYNLSRMERPLEIDDFPSRGSNWKTETKTDKLIKIAEYFGVAVDYFVIE